MKRRGFWRRKFASLVLALGLSLSGGAAKAETTVTRDERVINDPGWDEKKKQEFLKLKQGAIDRIRLALSRIDFYYKLKHRQKRDYRENPARLKGVIPEFEAILRDFLQGRADLDSLGRGLRAKGLFSLRIELRHLESLYAIEPSSQTLEKINVIKKRVVALRFLEGEISSLSYLVFQFGQKVIAHYILVHLNHKDRGNVMAVDSEFVLGFLDPTDLEDVKKLLK